MSEAERHRSNTALPPLSIVIPVHNECASIVRLLSELDEHLSGAFMTTVPEVIVVDDHSTDDTVQQISARPLANYAFRLISHRSRGGQSAAIFTGVQCAKSEWIATLDGDGQNDPADLLRLYRYALDCAADGRSVMVCGRRLCRRDVWQKRVLTWLLNRISAIMLSHPVIDKGCGLKIFRRQEFLAIPSFDHMHRFLPGLFRFIGTETVSVPVNHRARFGGSSHYGVSRRFFEAFSDILGIRWLAKRRMYRDVEHSTTRR